VPCSGYAVWRSLRSPYLKSSITSIRDLKDRFFEVTHPYHPLYGQNFELVNYTLCWGEARVYFYNSIGCLCSMPAAWTSVGAVDPVVKIGEGRSPFRLDDLLILSEIVQSLNQEV